MTEAAVVGAVVGHAVHASAHVQPGAGRRVDVPPGAAAVPGLHGAVVCGRRHRVEGPRLIRVPRVHRACGQRRHLVVYEDMKLRVAHTGVRAPRLRTAREPPVT